MWEWVPDHRPITYHATQKLLHWGSVGIACWRHSLTTSFTALYSVLCEEDSLSWDSPLGLALNSSLYFWHPRVWWITWPSSRAASTTAQIWCRAFSCSGPHSRLAAYWVTLYMGQSHTSRCGMCCLQNPKRPSRHCAAFFMVGDNMQ